MSRSSAWASVLTSLTGESWSDPVIGLNGLLSIIVLELLSITALELLERFGAGSPGSPSSVTGE
jgi:hypothetical protein